jgi:hypothetical protein
MIMPSRTQLLNGAKSFCAAFSSSNPPSALLTHFSSHTNPSVHEYGLPCLAPFLGRAFTGREGVLQYFETIAEYIRPTEEIVFDGWMVDVENSMVSVKGETQFIWKPTGERWDETFCYRLKMIEEGEDGECKVEEYRIWADTGAGEFFILWPKRRSIAVSPFYTRHLVPGLLDGS